MSGIGELYDKLVVMVGQRTFPAYYRLVKRVLKEAAEDFPHEDCYDWGSQRYEEWFKKWFGSDLVKNSEKI